MSKFYDDFSLYDFLKIYKLRDGYWWFKHRLDPRHRYHIVNTGLKPGYYDKDTIILHSNMSILCKFIEIERGGENKVKKDIAEFRLQAQDKKESYPGGLMEQANYDEEALKIYNWWKRIYPQDLKQEEYLLRLAYPLKDNLFEKSLEKSEVAGLDGWVYRPKKLSPYEEETMEWHWALAEKIERDKKEMLHRLINIYDTLWT